MSQKIGFITWLLTMFVEPGRSYASGDSLASQHDVSQVILSGDEGRFWQSDQIMEIEKPTHQLSKMHSYYFMFVGDGKTRDSQVALPTRWRPNATLYSLGRSCGFRYLRHKCWQRHNCISCPMGLTFCIFKMQTRNTYLVRVLQSWFLFLNYT